MPPVRRARRRTRRRTAVVVGGAAAVAHSGSKKRQQDEADKEADQAYEDGVADAQVQQDQTKAQSSDDYVAELEKLGELHDKGILTDEEFAAKKKEILAK